MIQISVTIEGQEDLTWPRWKRLVSAVERLGFAGLFRSDHFPGDRAALELVVSLTYLADHTERIHFSPLVAPMSFRDPAMLARQAAAIDDLSGGRMILGLGAGWEENEHNTWGYDLGDVATRAARWEEGLELITRLLRSDQPVTFEGRFFQLRGARLLPRPQRPGGPPILIGGNGPRRTLPLVARYADIWNALHLPIDVFRERSALLDNLLQREGRRPTDVKRTMMLMVWCGGDEEELKQRASWVYRWAPQLAELPWDAQLEQMDDMFTPTLQRFGGGFAPIVGTPKQAVEQIQAYATAGLEELIMQWFDVEDLEGLEFFAEHVLPRLEA